MMPAAKHGDVQMGVDIHLCTVPTPAPTPLPLPTPHMSVVFDPFDYVPVIGATITVCGMKRATAGTAGKVVHIPPGFPFAPKLPDTEDELFMGSATVVADGDPMSHIAHPVLSCQAAGMMSPFRLKKKGGPRAMVLPTVFNLATPTTVFVGGPPTISLMGMAMKGVFAGLGKLAKSGVFKRLRQKLFKNMKPGFLKCVVLRAEPVNILSGAVSVEQLDFELPGRLPLDWVRCYDGAATGHVGVCGPGWQTLLDLRLEVDPAGGVVTLHGPQVGPLLFDRLPAAPGDAGMEREWSDGARLTDEGDAWQVRTKDDRLYRFPKALAARRADGIGTVPIGRLADRCGNGWDVEYRGGRPSALVESAGRRLALAMADGRLAAVTLVDAATGTDHGFVRYEYDAAGDLVAVIDAMGAPYRFDYGRGDTAHHLLRHTDRVGLNFHYAYEPAPDGTQRVVHAWGDGGLYDYRFEYLDALNQRRITDSLGHASLVQLDDRGLPINEIDPLGGMTVYEYDDAGRTTAVVDPCGRRTAYGYDERGNLCVLEQADGTRLQTRFDDDDRPVEVQAPDGSVWRQRFDGRGLTMAQCDPLGAIVRYVWDDAGQLVSFVDALGAVTRLAYDAHGQLAAWTDPLGRTTRSRHDLRGCLLESIDPLGRCTAWRHDRKGRLVAVRAPGGGITRCDYDAQDRPVRYVGADGAVTSIAYRGLGKVARKQLPDGGVVLFEHDTEERLVAVQDAAGGRFEFERDALGRIVQERDPAGGRRRHAYDAGGHLLQTLEATGARLVYRSDALGRIVERRVVDTDAGEDDEIESFDYDACGRLVAARNRHAVVERRFDAAGRVCAERQQHADGLCFVTESAWDAAGRRVGESLQAGTLPPQRAAFVFDAAGDAVGLQLDDDPLQTLRRDEAGQIVAHELVPGVWRRAAYDADGVLCAQRIDPPGAGVIAIRYRYDAAGHLVAREDSVLGNALFELDAVGRLAAQRDPLGVLERCVRDAGGQRWLGLIGAAQAQVEGLREAGCDGAVYRFDGVGRVVERRFGDERLCLRWDALHRLRATRLERPGQAPVVTTCVYDAMGRRLHKDTGTRRTHFGWDGDRLVHEQAGDGARRFVYGPGGFVPWAMVVLRGERRETFGYACDPNGAPTRLIDRAGRVVWSSAGVERRVDGVDAATQPLRHQGHYADGDTGLHHNRHRCFDPWSGQFVTPDPIGLAGGLSLYQAGVNPARWIDPLGLTACSLDQARKLSDKVPDRFKALFKCKEYAASLKKAIMAEGLHAEEVVLKSDTGLIFSDAAGKVISTNGDHVGIKVGDHVFDNLHPQGLHVDEWMKDLGVGFPGMRNPSITPF